jgi:DNA primase large subunit
MKIDEEILDAYVRSLTKAAEYQNKFINPVELKALIRRFMTLNTNVDPRVIDWVGVWDPELTYNEQLANFREHYPMYKWLDTEVTIEAFESARMAKLKRLVEEIEELDEESLRELVQLIQKELGGLPQAEQTKQKKEPVVQTSTPTREHTPPIQQNQQESKITLRVLAGVPVLLEARAFASAFSVEELCKNNRLLREAQGRIIASTKDFTWPWGDPLKDLLSFYLAVLVLSQIRDRRIWERFAATESRRAETFMNATDDEVLEEIWKDFLIRAGRSEPQEEEKTGFPYRIHVTDFQRLVKGIDGAEWRLENRTVWRGWVYVTRRELVRLISEEVKARILRRLEEVKVDRVPEPIKETAERIRVMLAARFAKTDNKQTTQTPP